MQEIIIFLKENHLALIIMLSYILVFFSGLSISDKRSVFSWLVAWREDLETTLKSLNYIKPRDIETFSDQLFKIGCCILAGAANNTDSQPLVMRLKIEYQDKVPEDYFKTLEIIVTRKLDFIKLIAEAKTTIGFLRKIRKINKELMNVTIPKQILKD